MNKTMPAFSGRPVYIVDGARTPFLRARGTPGPFSASDLATAAGRALLARNPINPADIDEVILGCVMPGPDESNIARITGLRLGIPEDVPAYTVQRNCASGMQALDEAASHIASGRSDLIISGGSEAMSRAPLLFGQAMIKWLASLQHSRSLHTKVGAMARFRPAMLTPIVGLLRGLSDPIAELSMGQTAENIAVRFNIPREITDAYALASHTRLAFAQKHHHLDEIIPLFEANGNVHEVDDGLRPDSNLESLGKLRPVFDRSEGIVTAGNSAQISDGAAMLLLASEAAVKHQNLAVLGRIVDGHWAGLSPNTMGLGPTHACTPLLQRNNLHLHDVDQWEINEAFAVQVLGCIAAWVDPDYSRKHLQLEHPWTDFPMEHLNIDGGGISLGHPVGASGARIVLHLLHSLKRNGGDRGIASLCIGGGQGGALLLEAA